MLKLSPQTEERIHKLAEDARTTKQGALPEMPEAPTDEQFVIAVLDHYENVVAEL
jgi:hypothetical protein